MTESQTETTTSVKPECWCGEVHDGPYGFEDWMHHHCTHASRLILAVEGIHDYYLCGHCGEGFSVELPDKEYADGN